jgi:hypothetical protein
MPEVADDLGTWSPLTVAEAYARFTGADFPWWIAGGWAIDLFIGGQTRLHHDIEIVVLRRDHLLVQAALAAWDIHAAPGDGTLRPWLRGEALPSEVHNTWCRPSPAAPWALEVLIEEARDDRWVYRRDARIEAPLAEFGRLTADGIPYVAPEIQLLYKSKGSRPRDEADFCMALPLLEPDRRRWLLGALATCSPDHPWLAQLSGDLWGTGRR